MSNSEKNRSGALATDLDIAKIEARVRGAGASGNGHKRWMWQRATAIVLIPLSLWFLAGLLTHLIGPAQHATIWLSRPHVAVLMALAIPAATCHLAIGLESIFADYVAGASLRMILRIGLRSGLILAVLASWLSLARLVGGTPA